MFKSLHLRFIYSIYEISEKDWNENTKTRQVAPTNVPQRLSYVRTERTAGLEQITKGQFLAEVDFALKKIA